MRLLSPIWRALVYAALALPALAQAPPAQPTPARLTPAERAARIELLIQQLGDEKFEVREAATKALTEIGNPARVALTKAAGSPDAETMQRAKTILEKLPKLTHTLVDALGQPIPLASVSLYTSERLANDAWPAEGTATLLATAVTDEDGRLGVPEDESGGSLLISVHAEHPDYGVARTFVQREKEQLRLPLVRRGSEAYGRAVTGQLLSAEGKPLAGAAVECENVRTPGEGLINPLYPRGWTLTDAEGRFAIYLPNENRDRERGDLIPQNSRYTLTISVAGDDSYLPWTGRYANTTPARIVLPRATRVHRFRFESARGGWVEDAEQLRNIRVQFELVHDGERHAAPLDTAALVAGRKLLPGKYHATCFLNGESIEYQPLIVAAESPEQLDFRLAPAMTYRGQVVSGLTDQPVAGAIVFAYRSTSRNNLALLTADDWKLLRECPSNPPLDHPAVKRLGEMYGVQGLVRADREGRFEIKRTSDRQFYGLIALGEDHLPFLVRVGSLKPAGQQADAGKFPLFPAARVLVRPVFDGQHLAVSPHWLPENEGQPEWFGKFRPAFLGSDRCLEYVHWLALNESQPVFVPAGVRLKLRLDSPYDDKWTPGEIAKPILLEPAATKDLGDVRFAASLPVAVRVVNAKGEPVEGFAVRRMYQGENAWCIAHNTDQQGLAHFHVHPNSQGQFRVSDLSGPKEITAAANLATEFKVSAIAPEQPFQIAVTDEQVKLLRTPPPPSRLP